MDPAVILGCASEISHGPGKMKVILFGSPDPLTSRLQLSAEMLLWQGSSFPFLDGLVRWSPEKHGWALRWDRHLEIPIISWFWHDSWHSFLPAEFRVVLSEFISLS